MGCGFDFKIVLDDKEYFVEVKGLAGENGGILFTNKEWYTAKKAGSKYYLALVSNIEDKPKIKFVNDPSAVINPKKQIYTKVEVQWTLSEDELP